jgi:hypothetical protein
MAIAPARPADQFKGLGEQPLDRFQAFGPITNAQAAFQQLVIA